MAVGHDARDHERHQQVKYCADTERQQDGDRHGLLRVLGLLRGGGDGLKPDVGEEDHPSSCEDATIPVVAERVGSGWLDPSWNERVPQIGPDMGETKGDHGKHNHDLEADDEIVDQGALGDAADENHAHQKHDAHRRQV